MIDSQLSGLINDGLAIASNQKVLTLLHKNGMDPHDHILLSINVFKFNDRNKKQERRFVITEKMMFNMKKQEVQRSISIAGLAGMTIAQKSGEFVLHIPLEYDYRYETKTDMREIIIAILDALYKIRNDNSKGLPLFYVNATTLEKNVTSQKEKDKGISKLPPITKAQYLSEIKKIEEIKKKKTMLEELKKSSSVLYATDPQMFNFGLIDFKITKYIGLGHCGKVFLGEVGMQLYAIKRIKIEDIFDASEDVQIKYLYEGLKNQIKTYNQHPNFTDLTCVFEDKIYLYMVTKYLRGGDLFQHLKLFHRFPEARAKFYAATIAKAIFQYHLDNHQFADLKPESIYLNETGHAFVDYFGSSIIRIDEKAKGKYMANPEYIAPEIWNGEFTPACDWWTLGILIYEMVVGIVPFFNATHLSDIEKIVKNPANEPKFPTSIKISKDCQDIILKLLRRPANERLGSQSFDDIKNHPWFADIKWENLEKENPPYKPEIVHSTQFIEQEYLNQNVTEILDS